MGSLAKHIDVVRRLAQLSRDTDKSLDQLHNLNRDMGVEFFDPAWHERFREKNVPYEALRKFLDSLTDDEISRIHAIMYSGRDDVSAVTEKEHFEKSETRADRIRTVLEKIPSLDTYLDRGVRRANEEGIDLDEF